MKQVMLDLETMGRGSYAAIIAIGAVMFDPEEYRILDEFNEVVSLRSSVDAGMIIDPETIMWWMEQGDDARKNVCRDGIPLKEALLKFSDWFGEDKPVWGDGATFDNVITSNAYSLCGMKRPWMYWNDRCYRTMKNLVGLPVSRAGTHHCAVDDARTQALHLMKILKTIPSNECT